MSAESDRLERAGRYVLGLMDVAERERAERDLEFDAKFRAAVVGVAERMHLFDLGDGAGKAAPSWDKVAEALAAMPHMRVSPGVPVETKPAPARKAASRRAPEGSSEARRRTIATLVFGLVAFVAGYLTGLMSMH